MNSETAKLLNKMAEGTSRKTKKRIYEWWRSLSPRAKASARKQIRQRNAKDLVEGL